MVLVTALIQYKANELNVMHTLGPGCQMMDPFGLWWTIVYEIQNLSSFSRERLNGGVKS